MSLELYQRIYLALTAIEEAIINNADFSDLLASLHLGTEQYCLNNSVSWNFLTDASLSPDEVRNLLNAAIAKVDQKLKAAKDSYIAGQEMSKYR